MQKAGFISVFAVSTLFIGSAFAESAVATVSAMARMALANVAPNSNDIEVAYFSNNLKQFEKHIDGAHWENFNSDPITGTQETTGKTVAKISQIGNIVSVVYQGNGNMRRIDYVMVREDGNWKVNDIIYPKEESAEGGSFREIMTSPHLTAVQPKQPMQQTGQRTTKPLDSNNGETKGLTEEGKVESPTDHLNRLLSHIKPERPQEKVASLLEKMKKEGSSKSDSLRALGKTIVCQLRKRWRLTHFRAIGNYVPIYQISLNRDGSFEKTPYLINVLSGDQDQRVAASALSVLMLCEPFDFGGQRLSDISFPYRVKIRFDPRKDIDSDLDIDAACR